MGRHRRARLPRSARQGASHPSGILVLDKPAGLTSFDVVKRVRARLGVQKAGHTGTLDPAATGVLPICLNEATKIAGLLLAEDKRYLATLRLGIRTDTYDLAGRVVHEAPAAAVTALRVEQLEAALDLFRGTQQQRPPAFSALHADGRRAHELARQGIAVELPLRTVVFHELRVLRREGPLVELSVHCSKGTYIRSLAEDLGLHLGCGAALAALRREQSGTFGLATAVTLEALECDSGMPPLISLDRALAHLPAVDLADGVALRRFAQGQPLADAQPSGEAGEGAPYRVRFEGQVVAIGVLRQGIVWPQRMLLARELAMPGAESTAPR